MVHTFHDDDCDDDDDDCRPLNVHVQVKLMMQSVMLSTRKKKNAKRRQETE